MAYNDLSFSHACLTSSWTCGTTGGKWSTVGAYAVFEYKCNTVELDIFTVILFSLYSRLVNNREIKFTLIIQRLLQYYSISAAIVKIKYTK